MAAGKAPGSFCGGGDRRLGFERDDSALTKRSGVDCLPA
jgi:hypothetical protein